MVAQENAPRNEWYRRNIVKVREDSEGQIRSVFVKIGNKNAKSEQVLERPIQKLNFICSTKAVEQNNDINSDSIPAREPNILKKENVP